MIDQPPDAKDMVDALSMAFQLANWEVEIHAAIGSRGFKQVYLPDCEFMEYYEEVPEDLLAEALKSMSPWFEGLYDSLSERVCLREASVLGRWWYYLEPLDCKGKLSPVLWVKRNALRVSRPPKYVKERAIIRFFINDPTSRLEPCEEEGTQWCVGASVEHNPWWYWDTRRASAYLSRLSPVDLQRELSSGHRVMKASEETRHLWKRRWTMRPIQYGPYEERTGSFPFPELDAIPFYRAQDQKIAFETIIRSHICITPIDDITDTEFASWKIIKHARSKGGFPRTEKRGRPRRDRKKVKLAASLVYEKGMTKYAAAKTLGMSRSTFLGYLNDWNNGGKCIE